MKANGVEYEAPPPIAVIRLARSLGILQSYATPEQAAAEIRAEFKRVGQLARNTGLVK